VRFFFIGEIVWSPLKLGFYVNSIRAVTIILFGRCLCSTSDFARVCFHSRVIDNDDVNESH